MFQNGGRLNFCQKHFAENKPKKDINKLFYINILTSVFLYQPYQPICQKGSAI